MESETRNVVFAICAAGAVVVILIWAAKAYARRRREREQREGRAHMFAEARAFAAGVQQRRALPTVATNIILKSGEVAFYSAPSVLYETRAVGRHQLDSAGVRSTSTQQCRQIDTGRLTVTSKRLIFDGPGTDRILQLSKLVSVESDLTAVEVSAQGRQKSMFLTAANPLILALIIRICCQADDPRDLSQTTLDVTFVE
jgi:hypothetical protein